MVPSTSHDTLSTRYCSLDSESDVCPHYAAFDVFCAQTLHSMLLVPQSQFVDVPLSPNLNLFDIWRFAAGSLCFIVMSSASFVKLPVIIYLFYIIWSIVFFFEKC